MRVVDTNPTDELTTAGLPVTVQGKATGYIIG